MSSKRRREGELEEEILREAEAGPSRKPRKKTKRTPSLKTRILKKLRVKAKVYRKRLRTLERDIRSLSGRKKKAAATA